LADINITRQHGMDLADARKAAFTWVQQAEKKFDMACTYTEGQTSDECSFNRSGVTGALMVDKDQFALKAKLGFFLSAFKDQIENEIVKNLDALIEKNRPSAEKTAAKKT
jgi:putative polyhydroxyalkanoate system protein